MIMTPVLVFIACVALAILFEWAYGFFCRHWLLPLDKELWALFYWLAWLMLGSLSGLIPYADPSFLQWMPMGFVAAVHILLCMAGEFVRWDDQQHDEQPPPKTGARGRQKEITHVLQRPR